MTDTLILLVRYWGVIALVAISVLMSLMFPTIYGMEMSHFDKGYRDKFPISPKVFTCLNALVCFVVAGFYAVIQNQPNKTVSVTENS